MIHKLLGSAINKDEVFMLTSINSEPKGFDEGLVFYSKSKSYIHLLKDDII